MAVNLKQLTEKLNYQFKNLNLLRAALTHRSIQGVNNERLEFLGDSIINFLIAELLYKQYPLAKEGELSRFRAFLVRKETLAELGLGLGLGAYLKLGLGETKTGGHRRESILADAMEALIAAIYLDGGLVACSELVHHLFEGYLPDNSKNLDFKDAKTRLQEYLQAVKKPLPIYQVVNIDGQAHQQVFHISCQVIGMDYIAYGSGNNRRRAEQQAAQNYLYYLEKK